MAGSIAHLSYSERDLHKHIACVSLSDRRKKYLWIQRVHGSYIQRREKNVQTQFDYIRIDSADPVTITSAADAFYRPVVVEIIRTGGKIEVGFAEGNLYARHRQMNLMKRVSGIIRNYDYNEEEDNSSPEGDTPILGSCLIELLTKTRYRARQPCRSWKWNRHASWRRSRVIHAISGHDLGPAPRR